jgi:hypothetical protein
VDNLQLYNLAVSELSETQREMFPHSFIGVLSLNVTEETWQKALDTATRSAKALCPDEESEAQR